MDVIDKFFAAQTEFQQHFGISVYEMAEVEDFRQYPWDGTDWTVAWEDPKRGWMEGCMNVQREAIQKDGLTLYLAENNGNVSWMVFDDAKRVDPEDS